MTKHPLWQASLLPLLTLILGLALLYGLESFINIPSLPLARALFITFVATWFFLRWKNLLLDKLKSTHDRSFIRGARFFLTLCILLLAALVVLDLLNIPIAALLTFGGIGGIALSFAAKDFLSNLFGTIMINLNGHITEGDFIRSTSKTFEGHVEKISWFHTRIRSVEKTILYVPNSTLTESIIENEGKRSHRRLVAKIPLSYTDSQKIATLTQKIENYLKNHPGIDKTQDISITLTNFGPYAIELTLYTYLTQINFVLFQKEQQQILLEIDKLVKETDSSFGTQTHLFLNSVSN